MHELLGEGNSGVLIVGRLNIFDILLRKLKKIVG